MKLVEDLTLNFKVVYVNTDVLVEGTMVMMLTLEENKFTY